MAISEKDKVIFSGQFSLPLFVIKKFNSKPKIAELNTKYKLALIPS